jgi:hypothetical protein
VRLVFTGRLDRGTVRRLLGLGSGAREEGRAGRPTFGPIVASSGTRWCVQDVERLIDLGAGVEQMER